MHIYSLLVPAIILLQLCYSISQIQLHPNLLNPAKLGEYQPRLLANREMAPLQVSQNLYYHMSLKLGTPGQSLRIMIDTGSDRFWVASSVSAGCGDNRNKFDSSASTSFHDLGQTGHIRYISAKIQGNVGMDLVSLGSIREETKVILAKKCVNIDKNGTYDGIMGLSSSRQIQNIFDLAYQRGDLFSPKFAVDLNNQRGNIPHLFFNIDSVDFPTAYYLNNTAQNHWCINLTGVYFDEIFYPIKLGYIDTGAPYLHFPSLHFKNMYDQYFNKSCKVEKRILCFCSQKLEQYPTLSIEHAKNRFVMTPKMYMARTEQNNICELKIKIVDLNKQSNSMLLGALFLKYYTVIYDKANNQIGFVSSPVSQEKDYIAAQEILNIFSFLTIFIACFCIIMFLSIGCSYLRKKELNESLNEQISIQMSHSQNENNPGNAEYQDAF